MKMNQIEEILSFAIEEEKKATDLYRSLAAKTTQSDLRESLLSFAAEEEKHKESLENVLAGDLSIFAIPEVDTAVFSEEGIEPTLAPETMNLKQAIRYAITAEQKAFRLYMTLAIATDDAGLKTIFQALAQQEAAHGKRFEMLFEQTLVEN